MGCAGDTRLAPDTRVHRGLNVSVLQSTTTSVTSISTQQAELHGAMWVELVQMPTQHGPRFCMLP